MLRPLAAALLLCPFATAAQDLICPQVGAGEAFYLGPDDDTLQLSADQAEITQEGLSTLEGRVRLIQGENFFEAQALSFDEQTRRVHVRAESLFRNQDLIVRSREAQFDLATESGEFLGTDFTLLKRGARGAAERIELTRGGRIEIEDVYYTTCAPGSRAWFLEAGEIELDREEGLGTARHARLRFGYVPIFYSPWFQFPIDDRRRSGFLFPTLGNSDNAGLDLRVPFYLNLASNYDATVTPRYMADRGTQFGGTGRYLFQNNTGNVAYEFLGNDRVRRSQGLDSRRSFFEFDHVGLVNRRLGVTAQYGEVSDEGYFEDLGDALDAAAITHLERSAQLTYAAPAAYTITARVADYQTVARNVPANVEPYKRLPQLRIDALTKKALWHTRLGFSSEYVNFSRDIDVPGEPSQGQRLDLNPYVRFSRDRTAWYLASQADWRYTQYKVPQTASGVNEPNRSLPLLSAEGGLRFERLTRGGELQTLEPTLFYLYVPFREQAALPEFDVGEPDFDFVQLFARNRFSGEDRISDANHLATAFTSRLINPADGRQRFSVSVGQIFRFETPRVMSTGQVFPQPENGGTDYIAEIDYRPLASLSLLSTGQWSPDQGEFVRSSAAVRYRGNGLRGDLSYRYRTNLLPSAGAVTGTLEQTDASAVIPLFGGISSIGRWRYSLEESRTLEAIGGLEYETCCWALRGAYRRYQFSFANTIAEPLYTTSLYIQLELRGLSRIGAGFQTLLPAMD